MVILLGSFEDADNYAKNRRTCPPAVYNPRRLKEKPVPLLVASNQTIQQTSNQSTVASMPSMSQTNSQFPNSQNGTRYITQQTAPIFNQSSSPAASQISPQNVSILNNQNCSSATSQTSQQIVQSVAPHRVMRDITNAQPQAIVNLSPNVLAAGVALIQPILQNLVSGYLVNNRLSSSNVTTNQNQIQIASQSLLNVPVNGFAMNNSSASSQSNTATIEEVSSEIDNQMQDSQIDNQNSLNGSLGNGGSYDSSLADIEEILSDSENDVEDNVHSRNATEVSLFY